MGKALDYFPAFFKYRQSLGELSDAQVGRVFRAALEYAEDGVVPQLEAVEAMAFSFLRGDIDRARIAYEERCRKNQENAEKRWAQAYGDSDIDDANVCDGMRSMQMDANDAKQTNKQTNITNNPLRERTRARAREERKNQEADTHGEPVSSARRSATSGTEPEPPTLDDVRTYCAAAGLTHIDPTRFWQTYDAAGWMRGGHPIRNWRSLAAKWDAEDAERDAQQPTPMTSFDTDDFFAASLARSYNIDEAEAREMIQAEQGGPT